MAVDKPSYRQGYFIISRNPIISKKKMMRNKYTNTDLEKCLEILMPKFLETHQVVAELCRGITLTEVQGMRLIYSGSIYNTRSYRMLLYVLLLNETSNLKDDAQLAYKLLKEAYIMTDNIYGQLKRSTYPFVLADHLIELEAALPNRNTDELNEEEKDIYNKLPEKIKVYRGMCDAEKQSGQFGISWTRDKDHALEYVFYKKNEVQGTIGWIAEMEIDKREIFAVWGVKGETKEIVITPKKCRDVKFHKETKKSISEMQTC